MQKLETAKMSKMEKEGRMRDEKRRSGIGLMICAGNACPERLSSLMFNAMSLSCATLSNEDFNMFNQETCSKILKSNG